VIAPFDTNGSILTTTDIATYLTHRAVVKLTTLELDIKELDKFKYILLNLRHPGWRSSSEIARNLLKKLKQTSNFN
jgi:hypothetical protein